MQREVPKIGLFVIGTFHDLGSSNLVFQPYDPISLPDGYIFFKAEGVFRLKREEIIKQKITSGFCFDIIASLDGKSFCMAEKVTLQDLKNTHYTFLRLAQLED